jgi:hypothetical protein
MDCLGRLGLCHSIQAIRFTFTIKEPTDDTSKP